MNRSMVAGVAQMFGSHFGSRYLQCGGTVCVAATHCATHVSVTAFALPSGMHVSTVVLSLLHATSSGTHMLQRFASTLQPGAPHAASSVPSPLALHDRAAPFTHATNSPGVHVSGFAQSRLSVHLPACVLHVWPSGHSLSTLHEIVHCVALVGSKQPATSAS